MNLFLLSKYRTQLMGIATVMIIVCHSVGFGCQISNSILKSIIQHCSLGVDIFLFLSGLGCWYSLRGGGFLSSMAKKEIYTYCSSIYIMCTNTSNYKGNPLW